MVELSSDAARGLGRPPSLPNEGKAMAHCFPFLVVTIENTRSQETLAIERVSGGVPRCPESYSWDSHDLLLCVPPPELVEAGIVHIFDVF